MNRNKIKPELFVKNRSKLKNLLPEKSCCVVFSNDEMPRNGDQYFPFRQSSDFFYLTGIEQEKSILILAPGHPDKKMREILLILESNPLMETWIGHKLTKKEAEEISGIERIEYLDSYKDILSAIARVSGSFFLNIPELPKFNPENISRERRLAEELKSNYPLHRYERLFPVLRDLRVIKEEEEIESIKRACNITRMAFSRVLKSLKPGINEKEIEAEISFEFIRNNCGHAYPPIVGSGKNACILHYTVNDQICKEGDLLLMDFGAEYNNYAADCSRTIPVSGKYTPRQAEIYDHLHKIFRDAIALMEPGRKMEEVHTSICEWMKQFHIDIGLYTKKQLDEAKQDSPLWFKYYMHGSGHSLGLDVHDVYDKESKLAPGMIFTCEPGIYIPEENLGIRIENDILITKEGNIDLMADIPSERKEIEKLMSDRNE